jgi:hypothetical protein
VGEGVVFIAEGSDRDDDELTFIWKDGQSHLGAGERITLNWTTPGLRTIDCHVSDGYLDLVYAKVLVNVTKIPVRPGSGINETGTGDLNKATDARIAYYLLPIIALALIVIMALLAVAAARNRARKVKYHPQPETLMEPVSDESVFGNGPSTEIEILDLEPVPLDEGLPESEVGPFPSAAIDPMVEEATPNPEITEEEMTGQRTPMDDDSRTMEVPILDEMDLQAELTSIEDTLNEMLGTRD